MPDAIRPTVTPGRLEVSRTVNGVKIVAEEVPVSRLAARIGEALGVDTRVDRGLEYVVVSMYTPEITIDALTERLDVRDVVISKRDWQEHHVLVFQNADNWGGTRNHPDLAPITTTVLDPVDMTADQLAALYCRTYATPVGSAQVVGARVLVMDRSIVTQEFARMLHALHEHVK